MLQAVEQVGGCAIVGIENRHTGGVQSVDETLAKVKSLGGSVCMEPMDVEGVGRMAVIQDPQGAMLSVIAYGM